MPKPSLNPANKTILFYVHYFFSYDIIAKTETMDEDTACILERMNLQYIHQNETKRRESLNEGRLGRSANLTEKHFKTLSQVQIDELINIYRWDFEAFGYDFKRFENIGRKL